MTPDEREARLRVIRAAVKTDALAAIVFLVSFVVLQLFGAYQCEHRKICLWSNHTKQTSLAP